MKNENTEEREIITFYGSDKSNSTSTPIRLFYNTQNEIFIEIGDIDLDINNYQCLALDKKTAKLFLENLKSEINYLDK